MNKLLWIVLGLVTVFGAGLATTKVFWPNVQVVDRTDSTYIDSITKAYSVKDIAFEQVKDSMQKVIDKKPTIIVKKVIVPVIVKKDSIVTVTHETIQMDTIISVHNDTIQLPPPIIPEITGTNYGADNYVYSHKSNKIVLKLRTKYLLQGESVYIYNGEDLEDPLVTYYDYRTLPKKIRFTTSSLYVLCVSGDKEISTRFRKLIKNKNTL